jgi:hypothetical protein
MQTRHGFDTAVGQTVSQPNGVKFKDSNGQGLPEKGQSSYDGNADGKHEGESA